MGRRWFDRQDEASAILTLSFCVYFRSPFPIPKNGHTSPSNKALSPSAKGQELVRLNCGWAVATGVIRYGAGCGGVNEEMFLLVVAPLNKR